MIMKRVYNDILTKEAFIKDPYELVKDDIESKDWGSITDIIIGFKKHEENYILFSQYFTNKYLEKFMDNNFEKLFHTLIKLIIIKKENWTIVNQYKNMMLMESMINYLNDKGKINILYNKYDWTNISEEKLIDDDNDEVYEREWFALTNMYKILEMVPKFVDEINSQNQVVYKYMKESLLKENIYIINYWNVFYNDFDEIMGCIKNKSTELYCGIIDKANYLDKEQKKQVLKMMFKSIPKVNGFDKANIACTMLIKEIRKEKLDNEDLEELLDIMNNNQQIYNKVRKDSELQMRTIHSLGINLEKYDNLKVLLGE